MELWKLGLVRWLIAGEYGIRLSGTSTWRLMTRMGLSAQRPLWRGMEQNAGGMDQWKRDEYPKIQAQAKAARSADLVWRRSRRAARLPSRHHVGAAGPDAGGENHCARYR
jgi:hypothetical protein